MCDNPPDHFKEKKKTMALDGNWNLTMNSPLLPDLKDILPLVTMHGSDSQSLDNMLEVYLMGGLDPMHAMRLLMPPAWQGIDAMDPDLRAFYEFYAPHLEPWDGPAGRVLIIVGRWMQRAAPGWNTPIGLHPAHFRQVITNPTNLLMACWVVR